MITRKVRSHPNQTRASLVLAALDGGRDLYVPVTVTDDRTVVAGGMAWMQPATTAEAVQIAVVVHRYLNERSVGSADGRARYYWMSHKDGERFDG